MQCQEGTELSQVLSVLPLHLQEMLCRVNEKTADALSEIRLRCGRPIVLVTPQNTYFLTKTGKTTCICSDNLPTISESEISDIVARACGFSVHSHQEELKNGFLTLPGGHRIGVCGTAVRQNGCVAGIRSPTALNIRIARRIRGAAHEVLNTCFQAGLQNILLAGPPMSGKTTVLRDLAIQISQGFSGRLYTCAVIDARYELFPASHDGALSAAFLGDVLYGYEKAEGIAQAVRTLSPDMVFCDEIGSSDDAKAILEGCRCGVHFAATAHADSPEDLERRVGIRELLADGCITTVLFLGTGSNVGRIRKTVRVGERDAQNDRAFADSGNMRMDGRILFGSGAQTSA